MPTVIGVITPATAAIVDGNRRSVSLPIGHALGLISMTPIAPLTHVAYGFDHLLLSPHRMTLGVSPGARRCIASSVALLIIECIGSCDAGTQPVDIDANIDTD